MTSGNLRRAVVVYPYVTTDPLPASGPRPPGTRPILARAAAVLGVVAVLAACSGPARPARPGPSASSAPSTTTAGGGRSASTASSAPTTPATTPAVNPRAMAGHGKLAFLSGGRLYVLDGAGASLDQVDVPAGMVVSRPAWSFDGRWLAFDATANPPGASASALTGVWVASADGSSPRVLRSGASGFSWSPAADRLAVSDGTGAAAPTAVFDLRSGRHWALSCACDVAWTSDGVTLAAASATATGRGPEGALEVRASLTRMPSDGGRPTPWYSRAGGNLELGGWWPGGGGVLFWFDPGSSSSLAADGLDLFALATSGAPHRVATTLVEPSWLAWSPDRTTLAVVSGGNREIWSDKTLALCEPVRDGGCTDVPVPAGYMAVDPAWSPNGALAYVRAGADFRPPADAAPFGPTGVAAWYATRTLWLARPDGSGAVEIAGAGTGVAAPEFSSDGRWIMFVRDDGLWLVPVSGGGTATEVAAPLFGSAGPPNYYGQIDWPGQFAWYR